MIDKLRDLFDPNRSVPLFIIGTAALTLVLQALYDWANDPAQWQGGYWLALVGLVVATAALVISARREPVPGRVNLAPEQKPVPHTGLILLAGPNETSAPAAIEYHQPRLRHCWVIATASSRHTALALEEKYETEELRIHQGTPYVVDEDKIHETYEIVMHILTREAPDYGVAAGDMIADITGGLKLMTAGMTMACLARGCDMQYMKSLRDGSGAPVPKAKPEPIWIEATFVPERVPGG